ncbi:MAG: hypothetical protein NWE98_08975 [Candidatus Bathyarchaeota archaeon]|nr:hypothetical protein [Candidatus Bathyarchaeota archaeon]
MPTARGGFGLAVANGKIYAIGGTDGENQLNTVEEYNPQTDRWIEKTPMPTARSGFAIATYMGKIYVIGGTVGKGYVGNNEMYDPLTNTWQTKASMPTPRADLCANVVNDRIYLIGGKKYSSVSPFYTETAINEVYNPVNDTWGTATPLPTGVQGYASTVLNGKIYIMGGSRLSSGSEGTIVTDANQVYNPQTGNWSIGAKMSSTVSYGAAAATEGFMVPKRIYCTGGFSWELTGQTQVYFPENNTWAPADPMPTPRIYLGFAIVNDVLYAIGGYDGSKWVGTNEKYIPIGYGTVPPYIQITSPENKTYTEVSLGFSVNRAVEWVGYSLDNQANVTVKKETKLPEISQGQHSLIIYANDSLGNMGASNTVFFSIDRTGPKIEIILPQNKTYDSNVIQLVFTLDENITALSYSLDGRPNVEIVGNVTLPAISNGNHRLTVYASDLLGNTASTDVYFNITPFPIVAVAAALSIVTILLAAGYIFLKHRKSEKKNQMLKQQRLSQS